MVQTWDFPRINSTLFSCKPSCPSALLAQVQKGEKSLARTQTCQKWQPLGLRIWYAKYKLEDGLRSREMHLDNVLLPFEYSYQF